MKIEKLNFKNEQHRLFAEFLILKNAKYFLNDYLTAEMLLARLRDVIKYLFICFDNGKPYGIIWADHEAYNMFQVCALTDKEHNFFKNKNIFESFVKIMFEVVNADKLKAEILVFNTSAEFTARACGFKKEGILLGETRINGKPLNMLSLGLLKEEYQRGIKIARADLKNIANKIKSTKKGFRDNGKNKYIDTKQR